MDSTTVRVTSATWKLLRELAADAGISMQDVLQAALEDYRRKQILEHANLAYAQLRKESEQWAEEVAERRVWEQTLEDGLDEEGQ